MGYDYILFKFPCLEIITTDFILCPDCVLLSAEIWYRADQICCNRWLNFKQTLEQRNNQVFLNAASSGCDDPKTHHQWYTVPSVSNRYTQTYNLKLRYRLGSCVFLDLSWIETFWLIWRRRCWKCKTVRFLVHNQLLFLCWKWNIKNNIKLGDLLQLGW